MVKIVQNQSFDGHHIHSRALSFRRIEQFMCRAESSPSVTEKQPFQDHLEVNITAQNQ